MKNGRIRLTLAVIFGLASPVLLCSDQALPAVTGVILLAACLLLLGSVNRQEGAR